MSTSGFINVLKPTGMTSHDVVSFIRRTYGLKKVGHAGTLDPAAAGVLPIALGSATRLIEYITDADKGYRAELTFGYKTDSGDDMGEVIEQINNLNKVFNKDLWNSVMVILYGIGFILYILF